MLRGKTFWITGATGRLGTDLTARVENLGATAVPLVFEGYPPLPKTVPWSAKTQPIAVGDGVELSDLPIPDHVIHLHWKVDRTRPFDEQVANELNWNVHRFSFFWEWLKNHQVKGVVNCSSIGVFSSLNTNPIKDDTKPRPRSPYGIAKLAGEKFLDECFDGTPTTVTHIRLGSVCSFGENPSQLFSRLASSVFDQKRIQVNTGHSATILYIDEAVDILINAAHLGNPGKFLVVGPARPIEDIAREFEKTAGKPLNAEFVNLDPEVSDLDFVSDIDVFRADWVRVTSLHQAMIKIQKMWTQAEKS